MPPLPGEETLLTLFADVHYYFNNPTAKPIHHRFEKGSYVYLHRNSIQRRGRIEVANNAGTADQDAFDGFLDDVFLQYSYKHDTLFTLTVQSRSGGTPSPIQRNTYDWQIPGPDQHNQGRYMLQIHTLDLYFWTKEDALQFLEGVRTILPDSQMRILNAPVPPTTHQDNISTVVQKLEHVAVNDPSYGHAHRPSQSGEVSAASTTASPIVTRAVSNSGTSTTAATSEPPANYAPMAYNPSAPAAPEPVTHREKTPPPIDVDGTGTGLGAAAAHDQYHAAYGQPPVQGHNSFAPPPPQPQGYAQGGSQYPSAIQRQPTFPNPPIQRQQTFAGPPTQAYGDAPPPPSGPSPAPGHLQRAPTSSFPPPPPGAGAPVPGNQYGQPPQHTPPPPQRAYTVQYGAGQPPPQGRISQQYAGHQQAAHGEPAPSPYAPTPPPAAPAAAPPPKGGYSQYQYGSTQAPQGPQAGSEPYNVHQQLYRPTQVEAQSHVKPAVPGEAQNTQPSRLTGTADKVGKGLGGLFKKVEKKIG